MKPEYFTLRPAEVARFLRPSGLVVIPCKEQPLLPPRDKYPTMYDARVASALKLCPLGGPGTQWVGREPWGYFGGDEYLYQRDIGAVGYKATHDITGLTPIPGGKWRPARSMPDWAARIRKTTTRVELRRVRTITEAECELLPIAPHRATDHPRGVWYTAAMAYFTSRYPGAWDRDDYAWFVFYTDTH